MAGRQLLVLNGPSLGRLGRREPSVYGTTTLADVVTAIETHGTSRGFSVVCRQSNHEGALLDWLLGADDDGFDGVILNAGAYAHTSLAIADAIRSITPLPVVEVHISNTAAREEIRQRAVVGAACRGRIEGFGVRGYHLALDAIADIIVDG